MAKTAEAASNIWKQFNESPDWTYPSTSNLIEKVLDVISAGGNLPATANLTLPPFVRMQDLKPADGIEVFIITDSVSLLGSKGAKKTEDNPHIHESLWPILSSNFKALTIKAISGCTTERILKEVKELVQAKAGGDPAAFNHVLIVMPTLNELCKNGHETIDQRNPLHLGRFIELGKILKPMKYKMVIGPGSAEKWKIYGKQSFDEMGAELYKEFSNNDIPVCSGLPLYNRMEMRSDGFHFNASHNNLSIYPAYLAASIELTMQIATLNDALQCLQAPAEYAGGNSIAEDLRNRVESILPSHQEGKKDFMKERDTKIRVSQQVEDPWSRYRDSFIDSNQTCEVAGLPRKLKEGDMLITKPRPQTNTDPKCYAVEGNNELGQVNSLLAYDEVFGPVLEIKTIMLEDNLTPTVRVKVPNYQSHTIEGEAMTPISPLRHYSLKGQPEVSNRYRTKEVSWSDVAKLHSKEDRENTWITVITGTRSIFSFHEKVQMAPMPAIKDAGGNLGAQDSAPRSEQRSVINRQINDESRLVWKVLPSHAHFEKNERKYLEYSKSTVKLLRHSKMHASNGAVCFQRYANAMYNQMLTAGHRGQYTKDNEEDWYWKNYHNLIWYIRRGCNKPRFEILAPANSRCRGKPRCSILVQPIRSSHTSNGRTLQPTGGPRRNGKSESNARNMSKTVSRDTLDKQRLHLRQRITTWRPRP